MIPERTYGGCTRLGCSRGRTAGGIALFSRRNHGLRSTGVRGQSGDECGLPQAWGGPFSPDGAKIATTLYAGSFLAGSGGYALYDTSSWDDFTAQNATQTKNGLCLVSVDTEEQDGVTWYLGAWAAVAGGTGLWRTTDWTSFQAQFEAFQGGMKLLDLDIHPSGGARWFTGAWGGAPAKQVLVHDLEWAAFTAKWKDLCRRTVGCAS